MRRLGGRRLRIWRMMTGVTLALATMFFLSTPTMASTKKTTSVKPLSSRLLTIGQMPTGWSVSNSSTSGGVGCLSHFLEPSGTAQTASAAISFENGNFPNLNEKIVTDRGSTSNTFAKIVKAINACKTISGTSNGLQVSGTIGQMSFPRYGDQSKAFAVSLTVSPLTAHDDLLIVRKGKVIMDINEEALGSVDTGQFENFVQTAIRDLTNPSKKGARSTTTGGLPTSAVIPPSFGGTAHPTFSPGVKGNLDVIYVGTAFSLSSSSGTIVPVEVWNGTSHPVSSVDISGPALSGSTVVGSGDSQDVEPGVLAPSEVAFGMVFYSQDLPSGTTFNLTATGSTENNSSEINLKVVQANYSSSGGIGGPGVVGTVTNPGQVSITNPIPTDLYCFDSSGALTYVWGGFVAGNAALPPGATGSFSIDILNQMQCSTFLVGSSGYAVAG